MPIFKYITIQPIDLQNILEELKAQHWTFGPVIIRDSGSQWIIRDMNEQMIKCIDKTPNHHPSSFNKLS